MEFAPEVLLAKSVAIDEVFLARESETYLINRGRHPLVLRFLYRKDRGWQIYHTRSYKQIFI